MPRRQDGHLPPAESTAITERILEELARRRVTRLKLADDAKISISTLEKALSGRRPLTLATVVRIEQALGVALRKKPPSPAEGNGRDNGLAPDDLGSYARPAISWIEGDYLTIRPSFSEPSVVYAYRTQISWNEASSILTFQEFDRTDTDYAQSGRVSIPHQSGHIYFVTHKHGQYRLVIVSRPTIKGELHGILLTLLAGSGARLSPAATPIVYVPLSRAGTIQYGQIRSGDGLYAAYRKYLKRTIDEPFATFLLP